jgi:predicted ArsR family transcriptional regulator
MSRNQQKDKQKFLEKLAKTPIVEVACKQAGLPRTTYYRWRNEDEDFAADCDEAIERSSDLINDMAESQLISAIKEKNLTAIMYWLRHHHRTYRTRVEVDARIETLQQELTPEQIETVSQALRLAGLIDTSKDKLDGTE